MPTLIKWRDGRAEAAEDPFTTVLDDMHVGVVGPVGRTAMQLNELRHRPPP